MSDLKFVAVSDDGKMLILQTPDGSWIEVPFDASLATSDNPAATANIGNEKLSPREIQSRIRAGASPEALAAASGNDLARINAFAPPILLERQHVATKAARTIVRRASGAGPLVDVIIARLNPLGVQPADIEWDSFKREDGRWTVTVTYPSKEGERVGTWLFDVRNSALVPADDEARWLVGEAPSRGTSAIQQTETAVAPTIPHLVALPSLKEEAEEESGEVDSGFQPDPEPDFQPDYEPSEDVHPIDDNHSDIEASDIEEPRHDAIDEIVHGNSGNTLFDGDDNSSRKKSPSWDEILFGKQPDQE